MNELKWILPSSVSRELAADEMKEWAKSGILTPFNFLSAKELQKLKGIYVPYLLYSCEMEGQIFGCGKKKVKQITSNEVMVRIEEYDIDKKAEASYENIPVCVSKTIEAAEMEVPGTFDFSRLKPFEEKYLKDFSLEGEKAGEVGAAALAARCDAEAEKLRKRLKKDFANQMKQAAAEDYDELSAEAESADILKERAICAYLPIWIYKYQYLGKQHTVIMNGENGEVSGKLPKSIGKTIALFVIAAAVVFFAAMVLGGGLI